MAELDPQNTNTLESVAEKLNQAFYWVAPTAVVVLCLFGIWYSQTAPGDTSALANEAAAQIIPKVSEKMRQYSRWQHSFYFATCIYGLGFFLVFLNLGAAGKLRDWAEKRNANLLLQIALFKIAFSLISYAAFFPLSFITDFWFDHHFGMSSQSLADWLIDDSKSLLIGLAIGIPTGYAFYYCVRKFKKGWPYLMFSVSVVLTLFFTFVEPIVFEPIFNKLVPMEASKLKSDIKDLATRAKLADAPVYVVNKHKQTNAINAHVSGIGPSARIVIWDNTLERMPHEQVLCIVAHEIGHYALNHLILGCILGIGASAIALLINIFVSSWFFARTPEKWGIRSLEDIAGIPLILLLAAYGSFFAEPIAGYYSRTIEAQADSFGVRLHKDPLNFAKSFATLSKENLSEPNPPELIKLWLFSHPSLAERINSMMSISQAKENSAQ
jgi:Zn-dependent protease with chaperone function